MNKDKTPYDFDQAFRIVLRGFARANVVLGFVILFLLIWYLREVLLPFALALILAYLLNPVVTKVQAHVHRRWLAVFLTVFGFSIFCAGGLAYLIPRVASEVQDFSKNIGELYSRDPTLGGIAGKIPRELVDKVVQTVGNVDEKVMMGLAEKALPKLWGIVTGAFGVLVGVMTLVLIFMYMIFLLLDFQAFESRWKEYLPPNYKEPVVEFIEEFRDAMSKYFRGQFIVAMLTGILSAIGFSIVGIRLALLLGLFIGILNMVPYLQIVGVVPAFMLGILRGIETDHSVIGTVLALAIVFIVIQIIQDTLLVPRIIGRKTGLRPAAILFSMAIWGKLLGFLGVVTAIPLTCLVFAHYRRLLTKWRKSKAQSR